MHPGQVDHAAERLAELILELAGGELCEGVLSAGAPIPERRSVSMRTERCRKILGVPVYQLLGGAHRTRIRVYANGWYTNPGTPAQNAQEAKEVVDMGYTALKFDPFGQRNYYKISLAEAQLAEERVAAVREAVGPHVDILVEAHARFDPMNAIQLGKRLEKYRPLFYEEPLYRNHVFAFSGFHIGFGDGFYLIGVCIQCHDIISK